MKYYLTILLLAIWVNLSFAQTVTINAGGNWEDAMLIRNLRPGYEHNANTNYASYGRLQAWAWSHGSYTYDRRSLVKFDLSQIPSGATVTGATLYLNSDPSYPSSDIANVNTSHTGSNAIYFQRVTQNWNVNTVTWNNQPSSTISGRVYVPQSTAYNENITVDIKNLVQYWVDNPSANYGMLMKLATESRWRSRNYASEDNSNASIRPRLVIQYDVSCASCRTEQLEISNFSINIPSQGDFFPGQTLEFIRNESVQVGAQVFIEDPTVPNETVGGTLDIIFDPDGGAPPFVLFGQSVSIFNALTVTITPQNTSFPSNGVVFARFSETGTNFVLNSETINVEVTDPDPPTANAGPDRSITCGSSVQIGGNPAATDGTPPYTYSWSPASTLNNSSAERPVASPITTTTYTLTVTDSQNQTSTDNVIVTVNQANDPTPTVIGPNTLSFDCDNNPIFRTYTTNLENNIINYDWSVGGAQIERFIFASPTSDIRTGVVVGANWPPSGVTISVSARYVCSTVQSPVRFISTGVPICDPPPFPDCGTPFTPPCPVDPIRPQTSLYPNPVQNSISLEMHVSKEEIGISQFFIVNPLSGEVLFNEQGNFNSEGNHSIQFNPILEEGTYLLRVVKPNGVIEVKRFTRN